MELKPIAPEAIPRALQKAERYRLLEQPWAAESICLDVLVVEPDNQEALVSLVLAISDQLGDSPAETLRRARDLLPRIRDAYQREYYTGILAERRALVELRHGTHGSGANAYEWIREAMAAYERAEQLEPPDTDDATLRWNTCVRLLNTRRELSPRPEPAYEPALED
ncbi:MAG TPA: hypothetical protein VMM17_04325 [Gemmatimonadaceae bacterium]|nr:hypothetical protein [Gemmatimonadaceae bacterium]